MTVTVQLVEAIQGQVKKLKGLAGDWKGEYNRVAKGAMIQFGDEWHDVFGGC